jgi:hypothetical protein
MMGERRAVWFLCLAAVLVFASATGAQVRTVLWPQLTRGQTSDVIEQIRLNAVTRPIAARSDRASDPGGFVHAQRSRGSIAGIRAGRAPSAEGR